MPTAAIVWEALEKCELTKVQIIHKTLMKFCRIEKYDAKILNQTDD